MSATRSTVTSKCGDPLGEHDARQVIALRVLLPVEEMRFRLDLQRVGQDRRARVRRRPQADGLRAERDQPVVAVAGAVGQRDVKRHGSGVRDRGGARRGPETATADIAARRRRHGQMTGNGTVCGVLCGAARACTARPAASARYRIMGSHATRGHGPAGGGRRQAGSLRPRRFASPIGMP